MRTVRFAVCLVAAAPAVAGCGSTDPPDAGPIVLAATYSETGRFSRLGTEMARGYRLAVQMLNEKGGVKGREFRLVLRDDASDAGTAERIYREYVEADTIDVLLGPYSSPLTEVAIGVAETAGVPLVTAMAAAPGLWAGKARKWSVQMLVPGPVYLQGSVELAAGHGARSVALVYEGTQFPESVADGVRAAVRTHRMEIVLDRSYPAGGANHQALVAAARDNGADLFIGGGYYDDAVAFTRAVDAAQYTPMLLSLSLGPAQSDFATDVGSAAGCVAGNTPWLPTIRTSGFITNSGTLGQRYAAAHSQQPSYYAAGGFGAVELLAETLDATLDDGKGVDAVAVRDDLFSRTTNTVLGPYQVHALGDEQAGAQRALQGLQVQWQHGAEGLERVIVHPVEVADASPCFWR